MKIRFLKSFNGDAIVIRFPDTDGTERIILIDGGVSETYQLDKGPKKKTVDGELKKFIGELRKGGRKIDLLILTHIDDDHIAGILKWFNNDPDAHLLIEEVWFNSGALIADHLSLPQNPALNHLVKPPAKRKNGNTSIPQGIEFGQYIASKKIWDRRLIMQGDQIHKFGLEFKILSPDEAKLNRLLKFWKGKDSNLDTSGTVDDYSKSLADHIRDDRYKTDTAYPNGSSIAFILTYGSKNLLFMGDAHPAVVVKGLKLFGYTATNPLAAEMVKLSHHGSKGNTSTVLLKCLDARNYVISTNGRGHQHPHKQLLGRLIACRSDCRFYFNYGERINRIFTGQDREDYPGFQTIPLTADFEIKE